MSGDTSKENFLVYSLNKDEELEAFSKTNQEKRNDFRWSKMGLREKAEAISINDKLFKYSYKYTNLFIHPSPYEIMNSLILEEDLTFSPVESDNNESERKLATVGLYLSMDVLIRVMDKVNLHYSLGKDLLLQNFVGEFATAAKNQRLAG